MTKLYLIEPEVSGGLGEQTILTDHQNASAEQENLFNVVSLEYAFDDWLGDDLITTHPCFLVTEKLADTLKTSNIKGYYLTEVLISKSDLFLQIHEDDNFSLPDFLRIIPKGIVSFDENYKIIDWSGHDLSLNEKAQLVVTENFLEVLKEFSTDNMDTIELILEI